jgi:hypothetical protein
VALGWELETAPSHVKVCAVRDGPKLRIVSAAKASQSALAPLHNSVYDHLSRFPWLLRGDAQDRHFSSFGRVSGEVFVSGDYEGATDNLSLAVYQEVIRSWGETATHVPSSVIDLAVMNSESIMWGGKRGVAKQRRGQLMGNYLSFPALCLVNYLTFRWLVPRDDVPVRINGDDIVFRARPEEVSRWKAGVGAAGLVLSVGKTRVHERFFTLNSTLFSSKGRGAKMMPFIRAAAFLKKADSPAALVGQFSSHCPRLSGHRRRAVHSHFLRRNIRLILLSQRSLTRGFGMCVTDAALRISGLYRREKFYRSLDREEPLPRMSPEGYLSPGLPPGFRSFRRSELSRRQWTRVGELRPALSLAFRIRAQNPIFVEPKKGDWLRALREGTQRPWIPSAIVVKMAQKMKVSWSGFGRLGRKEARVVLPVGEEGGDRCGLGHRGQAVAWGS